MIFKHSKISSSLRQGFNKAPRKRDIMSCAIYRREHGWTSFLMTSHVLRSSSGNNAGSTEFAAADAHPCQQVISAARRYLICFAWNRKVNAFLNFGYRSGGSSMRRCVHSCMHVERQSRPDASAEVSGLYTCSCCLANLSYVHAVANFAPCLTAEVLPQLKPPFNF